jgi:hypothetical protein
MNYTNQTIFNEFRHYYGNENVELINFLNRYYNLVKKIPIDTIKGMLPINFHGFCGTYLESWMVKDIVPTECYPFSLMGQIYSWYGDRTTSDIVTSVANTSEELYQRMLIQYMWYLSGNKEYQEAKDELCKIIDKLTDYSK